MYTIKTTVLGQDPVLQMVSGRHAAADWVGEEIVKLSKNGITVDRSTTVDADAPNLLVNLCKGGQPYMTIDAYPAEEENAKVLEQLTSMIREGVTVQSLVRDVGAIMCEVAEGKHKLNDRLHMCYTVRDVRAIAGFYTEDWLIHEMTSVYIGRFMKFAAESLGMDVQDTDPKEMLPLICETDMVQTAATKFIKEYNIGRLGKPTTVDKEKSDKLMHKVLYATAQQLTQFVGDV